MRSQAWTLERAKNSFSAVVSAAERGEPQLVTKRGKRAVYVVAAEDYDRLTKEDDAPEQTLVDLLLSAPKAPPGLDVDKLFSRAEWTLRDVDLGDADEESGDFKG